MDATGNLDGDVGRYTAFKGSHRKALGQSKFVGT